MHCPPELRDHYQEGRLMIFVGAGASMSVQWKDGDTLRRGPSWWELVDEAARQLGFSPPLLRVRGTDLQILEYFRLKHGNAMKLNNWLVKTMAPPDAVLRDSKIHAELAKLEKCKLIYTTNYDNFIERSFGLHARPHRVVATEADMGISDGTCEIIKFHGDLEHPNQMVLSEADYHRRLRLDTEMDVRFLADLLGRSCLFIGYSFNDWNVAYIFRGLNDRFERLPRSRYGRRAFMVVPDPSNFERELFRDRNMDLIAVDGARITDQVAALLAELR